MKTVMIFLLVLACAGTAQAYDDICSLAAPFVQATTAQVNDFSDKRVVQHSFQGSGRVKDVRGGGLAAKFTVIVDCGNDVLAEVPTSSSRATNSLQVGETVSFSGVANGVYRRRYVNTHTYYIIISFNDNSPVW